MLKFCYPNYLKCWKLKKKNQNPKNKSQDEDLTQLQNEIKNSIKNLCISDQKNKKTINEYAELLTKIRNEYAKLQKENNQLKIKLHKYPAYVQNTPQRSYQKPLYTKPIRKENTIITMSLNNVKKVILMLQKFEDAQKNTKYKRLYQIKYN